MKIEFNEKIKINEWNVKQIFIIFNDIKIDQIIYIQKMEFDYNEINNEINVNINQIIENHVKTYCFFIKINDWIFDLNKLINLKINVLIAIKLIELNVHLNTKNSNEHNECHNFTYSKINA